MSSAILAGCSVIQGLSNEYPPMPSVTNKSTSPGSTGTTEGKSLGSLYPTTPPRRSSDSRLGRDPPFPLNSEHSTLPTPSQDTVWLVQAKEATLMATPLVVLKPS